MPELPEVETIVRELRKSRLIGSQILDVKVFWPRSIATSEVDVFCEQLCHQTILNISRRGKFIVFTLSQDTLLIHLRMTGKLFLSNGEKEISSHERLQLRLNDGRILHYEDQRKFGKWYLMSSPESRLKHLGLEPLSKEFTLEAFRKRLKNSSQQIKPFLLNQHYIVGLGNIYVDEALWEGKIHPKRKVNTLTPTETGALHHAISQVLEQGIAHTGRIMGSSQANYFSVSGRRGTHLPHLKVFRRHGLPCPRCHTEIIRIKVAQRSTHLCPNCQKY